MTAAASWVIRNKQTGEILFETYNSKVVAALNPLKYEAVPIGPYLASLNQNPATVCARDALLTDDVRNATACASEVLYSR